MSSGDVPLLVFVALDFPRLQFQPIADYICFLRCTRHSEIFMEGYKTWEGSGEGERRKEGRSGSFIFRAKSWLLRLLLLLFGNNNYESKRRERKRNPRGEERDGRRERACKSLPRPRAAFVIVSIERLRGRLRNAKHTPPSGEEEEEEEALGI